MRKSSPSSKTAQATYWVLTKEPPSLPSRGNTGAEPEGTDLNPALETFAFMTFSKLPNPSESLAPPPTE